MIDKIGFLKFLNGLSAERDRGTLADLRKGFSEATETRAWPYIAQYCDLTNERERAILLTLAAGFATLKANDDAPKTTRVDVDDAADETQASKKRYENLGTTFRKIALDGAENADDALKTFDVYFRRILVCEEVEDVCARLRSVFLAAKSKGVDVDWSAALNDLIFWNKETKTRWAAQYWGSVADPENVDPTLDGASENDAEKGA